jgi:hypothetical protein
MNTPTPSRADEQLFGLLKAHGHCDLLLDCTLGNPLHDEIAAEQLSEPPAPVNPALVALEPQACPVVIRLGPGNLALLDASIEVAQRHAAPGVPSKPVCAWLFGATQSAASVAAHLARQIIVRNPGGGKDYLRIHDPRVFAQLLHMATPEQLARWLRPFNTWVWMDRTGQLQRTQRPLDVEVHRSMDSVTLSAEQDLAVDRIELLNQTLSTLTGLKQDWPTEDDLKLDQWLVQARQKEHMERVDQLAYVLHAALVHSQFDVHPEVSAAIAAAKRSGLGLCAALSAYDDEFWDSVRLHGPVRTN